MPTFLTPTSKVFFEKTFSCKSQVQGNLLNIAVNTHPCTESKKSLNTEKVTIIKSQVFRTKSVDNDISIF